MKFFLYLFSGMLILGQPTLKAGDQPWMEVQKGIQYTISQHYDSSLYIFQHLSEKAPDDPLGPFFTTATYQAMMMDFETRRWEQDFLYYADQTIHLAQKRLHHYPDDIEARFYLGAVKSYKAFYSGKSGHYFEAIQLGLQALADLNKTVRLDSTFYDAYLGIGSFKYWKSQIIKRITRLPYLRDQRQEGIAMIQLAMEKGKFSTWPALNNLAWIEIENGNFARAAEYAEQGLAVFPDSRFFLWPAAEAYIKLVDLNKAIEFLERLLVSVQAEAINNHYNEILLHLKLARAYYSLGAHATSAHHCNLVLQLSIDDEVEDRIQEKRRQAQKLLEELNLAPELSQSSPQDSIVTD